MLKAYKYRIYPTEKQKVLLAKHFGCNRFIYNWALNIKISSYTKTKKSPNCISLINQLPELKKNKIWLKDVYSQMLQMSLRNLDNAFQRFFREKKGFPKFKDKHSNIQSYQLPQGVKIEFNNSKTFIPKVGRIKTSFSREFKGKIKTCTISRTSTYKYYISVLVDNNIELPKKCKIKEKETIGIDLGLKHFLITSNGEKISNPKYLRQLEPRLKVLQKRFSRTEKKSKNRNKARLKVVKIYEKITNRRTDFLQKLSTKLIRENKTICLEDLAVKNMVKNYKLAKSISDASWSSFVNMLKYKSEWNGKNLIFIGRFDPSSKMCSCCGYIKKDLKLEDRSWICPDCKTEHDRDINAATNIKKFGLIKVLHSGKAIPGELLEMPICNLGSTKEESL